jgi:hypothetical protein
LIRATASSGSAVTIQRLATCSSDSASGTGHRQLRIRAFPEAAEGVPHLAAVPAVTPGPEASVKKGRRNDDHRIQPPHNAISPPTIRQ